MSPCTHESGGFSWPAVLMQAEPAWKYRGAWINRGENHVQTRAGGSPLASPGPRHDRRRAGVSCRMKRVPDRRRSPIQRCPAGKVNCGRGTQARMGESHRSFGRADDFPADHPAGRGRPLCDSGWITRCTGRPAPLLVDRFLESRPPARVVATGVERCGERFHPRARPGLDLPGHRAFRHLRPGVAPHGNDSGPRPVCDRSWPCHRLADDNRP